MNDQNKRESYFSEKKSKSQRLTERSRGHRKWWWADKCFNWPKSITHTSEMSNMNQPQKGKKTISEITVNLGPKEKPHGPNHTVKEKPHGQKKWRRTKIFIIGRNRLLIRTKWVIWINHKREKKYFWENTVNLRAKEKPHGQTTRSKRNHTVKREKTQNPKNSANQRSKK